MLATAEFSGITQTELHQRFAALWEQYEQPLSQHLHRLYFNPTDAAERTQDVALKLWHKLPLLLERERRNGALDWRAYLYRIATNVYRDDYRHHKLIRWEPWAPLMQASHGQGGELVPFLGVFRQAVADAESDPAVETERREVCDAVAEVLALLPTHYRESLERCAAAECGYAVFAEQMGTTPTAVKSLVSRARHQVRVLWNFREERARLGSWGAVVAQERERAQLTRVQLGQRVQVPYWVIRSVEQGKACEQGLIGRLLLSLAKYTPPPRGQDMRQHRERLGLTRTQLAAAVGCTHKRVWDVEHERLGEYRLRPRLYAYLKQVAQERGISLEAQL